MAIQYIPPQVIVNGVVDYNGDPSYSLPNTVVLIANITKYPTKETSRILGNGATAVITAKNLIESSVTIRDYAGNVLVKDSDYTMAVDNTNDTFSITVINKDIKTQSLQIYYEFLPDNFFEVNVWYTIASITNYYGSAYTEDHQIDSPITAAADFAFKNGAEAIMVIPVFTTKSVTNPFRQTLDEALDKLRLRDDVGTIVPLNFDFADLQKIRDEVVWREAHQLECRAIFGVDGVKKTYTIDDLVTMANRFDSEFVMFMGNTIAPVYVTDSRNYVNLPGWLWAAAMAGLAMSTAFNLSLTRKTLVGFFGTQNYLYEEKNTLAAAGCCIIEPQNGILKVRHSLTTKQAMLIDWSFSGIYIYLKGALRFLLDPFIGKPSTDILLKEINAAVTLFLDTQKENQAIYDYDSLEVARRQGNPEIIDVNFRCSIIRPALWIYVTFYVDLTY